MLSCLSTFPDHGLRNLACRTALLLAPSHIPEPSLISVSTIILTISAAIDRQRDQ
jgi:hypothetical protein